MKYKVGDKVVVRRDLLCYERYGGFAVLDSMVEFRHKIVTIKQILNHCYRIAEHGWLWTDEMFEGLCKEDVKIEVGDLL